MALLFAANTPSAVADQPPETPSDGRGLSERLAAVFDGTFDSLAQRVQPSGYAATSLTGEYEGMFARDSAIQASAMLASGNDAAARSILTYLIGFGDSAQLPRAPRIVPSENYASSASNPVVLGNPDVPVTSYGGIDDSALLKLNAPRHGAALTFVADGSPVTRVSLGLRSLTDGPGEITVSLRESNDWDATVLAEAKLPSTEAFATDGKPRWVEAIFGDPVRLEAGKQYSILVRASAEPDTVVQLWGSQMGGRGTQRTYNYDGGWGSGPIPGRGAFKVFTERGVTGAQAQTTVSTGLFQVQGDGHAAAQSFVLGEDTLSAAWLPLSSQSPAGRLDVSVRTAFDDASSQVASGSTELAGLGTERSWVRVPLALDEGAKVEPGATYWIVVRADVANDEEQVVWHGSRPVVDAVGTSRNFDHAAYGGWRTENHSLGFAVNASAVPDIGPAFAPEPSDMLETARGDQHVVAEVAAGPTLSALDLFLAGAGDQSVHVTVTDATGRQDAFTVPADEVAKNGSWVRARFTTLGRGGDGTYAVRVSTDGDGEVAVGGHDGRIAYQALSLVYDGAAMTDQPDGTYMLVDAWARYVTQNPQDEQFVADTYKTVAAWADYYLTEDYLDADLQLLFNPEFEHSRRSWHIPTYDLITNVFASQALHELAGIARELPGQDVRAQAWAQRSTWLAQGIEENLTSTVEVDGRDTRIYTELLWSSGGRNGTLTRYDGYSWVNFAPIAADWYATNESIMAATYDAYLEHGSIAWTNDVDEQVDRMLLMDTEENTWEPAGPGVDYWERYAVIGKGLGWELMLAKQLGRDDRIATISHFLEVQTPGDVLGEFYYGWGPSDVGNQEQGSWWILGMLEAYPIRQDDPLIDLEVLPRCLAGKPYVAIRARNITDELLDIKFSSPIGGLSFKAVAPHKLAYQSFAARSYSGELTVTVDATSANGARQEHNATVAVPTCD